MLGITAGFLLAQRFEAFSKLVGGGASHQSLPLCADIPTCAGSVETGPSCGVRQAFSFRLLTVLAKCVRREAQQTADEVSMELCHCASIHLYQMFRQKCHRFCLFARNLLAQLLSSVHHQLLARTSNPKASSPHTSRARSHLQLSAPLELNTQTGRGSWHMHRTRHVNICHTLFNTGANYYYYYYYYYCYY